MTMGLQTEKGLLGIAHAIPVLIRPKTAYDEEQGRQGQQHHAEPQASCSASV